MSDPAPPLTAACACRELERPDLNTWAQAQHDKKAALEEQFVLHKQDVLQAKRQDRRQVLRERMRDRASLEAEAGQEKARTRDLMRQQARADPSGSFVRAPVVAAAASGRPIWRPSGYGQVLHEGGMELAYFEVSA